MRQREGRETATPLTEQAGSKPAVLLWDRPETQLSGETHGTTGPGEALFHNQCASRASSKQASKHAPTSLLQPSVSWCPSVPEGSAEHQQRVQPQQQHWEAGRALQIATRS